MRFVVLWLNLGPNLEPKSEPQSTTHHNSYNPQSPGLIVNVPELIIGELQDTKQKTHSKVAWASLDLAH